MSKFVKLQPWIGLVCRLTLGGVLFVAGFLKVDKLEVSQMAVRSYELLPIPIANFLGQTLPFFEVVIGLLLILGAATRAVAALGGFTMFIFIIAIGQAWARGLNIDCGCFGGGGTVAPGETRYLQEILRDAGLVAMALFLLRYPVSKFSVDKAPKQSNAGDTE
jgi:uncharacterized membrane protein YphA (DoxX/SURF4 family)